MNYPLQLGFPFATYTCNSWYLCSFECYWTSCSNCNGHPCHIQYHICGATHMRLYATSLQLISASNSHTHTNIMNEMPMSHFIHLSMNDICWYLLKLIYNYFTTSLTIIIFNIIHSFLFRTPIVNTPMKFMVQSWVWWQKDFHQILIV
jgi:hypothetical protein